MTTNKTEGARYQETKRLDIAAIAKLVRKDLAQLIAAGELQASRVSVRISRYAGGQEIRAEITVPFETRRTAAETETARQNPNGFEPCPWLTRAAYAAERLVEATIEAYNFDNSDSQSDYFHSRFHTQVGLVSVIPAIAPAPKAPAVPALRIAYSFGRDLPEKTAQVELMELLGL